MWNYPTRGKIGLQTELLLLEKQYFCHCSGITSYQFTYTADGMPNELRSLLHSTVDVVAHTWHA